MHTHRNMSVAHFVQANMAPNTRRCYKSDVRNFEQYGGRIPADPQMVIDYLVEVAGWHSAATISRRLMAIKYAHTELGFPSPTDDAQVKQVFRGIKRQYGTRQTQAKPVTYAQLTKIVRGMTKAPGDLRDKALLLLGFAGAFRRSELVGLDVEDLTFTEQGLIIRLRQSKTDQEGRGRIVAIPPIGGPRCPVAAVSRWIKLCGTNSGPLFRRLDRTGQPAMARLHAGYVSEVVKRRLDAIGVDTRFYSAHSLRAGLVT